MRFVHFMPIALVVAILATALRLTDGDATGSAVAAPVIDPSGIDIYRLQAVGSGESCFVSTGQRIDDATRSVVISEGCSSAGPSLAHARLWVEHPSGDVDLADEKGRLLLSFGASDGAAYETYRADQPLMMLTSLR